MKKIINTSVSTTLPSMHLLQPNPVCIFHFLHPKYIMKYLQDNHYTIMFVIMILSGLLSTMNVWVDKIDDIRFSINDVYMILLMTGWMFLFMGLIYK